MGEISEGLIDGTFDCVTGEYIGEPVGYPRTYESNHPNSVSRSKFLLKNQAKTKELRGVCKFLQMQGVDKDHEAVHLIRDYCKKHLDFEGTLNECAEEIQNNFSHFSRKIRELYRRQD